MSNVNDLNAETVARAERRAARLAELRLVDPVPAETYGVHADDTGAFGRVRSMAVHPAGKGRKPGEPYRGFCDGCELRTVQTVRDVSGHWGAATVCGYHERDTPNPHGREAGLFD